MSPPCRGALALVLVAGCLTAFAPAEAQQAPTAVRATVEVAGPPILLETIRNLQFGNVVAGQIVSVPAAGPHPAGTVSGGVRFTNVRKQDTQNYSFVLPTHLVRGSSSIPVEWAGEQFGRLCYWSDAPGNCVVPDIAFSPAAHTGANPLQVKLPNQTSANNFTADLYIGGRLTAPATGLLPGVYTGTISVILSITS